MRLPLAIPLDARTSSATKDARLTNVVSEQYQSRSLVRARPGLALIDSQAGAANGATCHDGTLITVFGGNAYKTTALTLISAVGDAPYDFAQTTT